jgi:hypothetical protein
MSKVQKNIKKQKSNEINGIRCFNNDNTGFHIADHMLFAGLLRSFCFYTKIHSRNRYVKQIASVFSYDVFTAKPDMIQSPLKHASHL